MKITILELGDFNIKVSTVLLMVSLVLGIAILLTLVKKIIYRTGKIEIAKKYAIYRLIKYVILVFTFIALLQIAGFNISVLIAGSAALLVGLGLGLQNLFSDFISGIVILMDSAVKVNDIIEVNGLVCKVQQINLRTTTVLTRDDKYIILPNSEFTRNQLINWTHETKLSRFQITIGVDYSTDVDLVMRLLKKAAVHQEDVLIEPEPFVRFEDYGESSLDFALYFWADEVFRVENIKSEIRVRIFEYFRMNNIKIPFPQRVIHNI